MSDLVKISVCFLIFVTLDRTVLAENEGILGKIKAGLKYASNYFDTVRGVADLVAKSLGKKQKEKRGEEEEFRSENRPFGTHNIVSAFFRLLGLDSKKVAAIAVNSVIFLAQMISSLFDLPEATPNVENEARSSDDDLPLFDPFKYIVNSRNDRLRNLLTQAQDPLLADQMMANLDGLDSACIQLFLCKITPTITAAQESLKNQTHGGFHKLTSWLPSREEYEDNSDNCEEKYTDCSLFPES